MGAFSPARFLYNFLGLLVVLWLLFIFASRLVALVLGRVLGASVAFRVGGWKCLQKIAVKFRKGPIESVSVGEIKVSLRQSLFELGVGYLSGDPKLQVSISDLKIVTRSSSKSNPKPRKPKKKSKGNRGRGKWTVVANMAKFLSVSITDLVVKTPKAMVELQDILLDISNSGGSRPTVIVRLQILPIVIHLGEPRLSCDQSSGFDNDRCHFSHQSPSALLERSRASFAPFICEELHLSCEFGHEREAGICIKNVEFHIGEVTVNASDTMLSKSKSSSAVSTQAATAPSTDAVPANKPNKKQAAVAALAKKAPMIPEQVSFSLPKLDIRFVHRQHILSFENRITGIQLRCTKSRSIEDVVESTRLDVQMDFSEINLLRESKTSVLEILKVDIHSLVYLPLEPTAPLRAEVDVKLGGTQCNLLLTRLKPLLDIRSSKNKKMVLQDDKATSEKPSSSEPKVITWTCTVSAPEMTIVLFSIANAPVFHVCSQSSHIFANNVSNTGTAVHMELGELNLYMEEEYQEYLKGSRFGAEANSGALVNVAKVSLDWGKKEVETKGGDAPKTTLALSVDVTGVGVSFTYKRVDTLVSTALYFKALLKSIAASKKKSTQSHGPRPPSSGKGTRLIKFNLERFSVSFSGEALVDASTIADPKRVDYGSQGGRIVFSECPDGTPRTATISSAVGDGKNLKHSVCLDISHFSVCLNKDKQSTQVELERARTVYEEHLEDDQLSCAKVTLLDIQNAKFVRREGGHKEISVCSLFSATDITVRWEPDIHLALVEIGLRMKLLLQMQKLRQPEDVSAAGNFDKSKEATMEPGKNAKSKKKESVFAVDIEMLTISAEAGDGVEALVQVHSIFSENARIGVLLEGLMLSFNGARILKSSRMQVSRIPKVSTSSSDAKAPGVTTWDWVVQGLDVHICLPYRLELRAIDDAVEDMLRALKIIVSGKTKRLFPSKTESSKPKKPSSSKIGRVKFCIRKLTADIEEEPMQGWLDEHYQLMKNEACELAVRLKYLDELAKGNSHPKGGDASDGSVERKFCFDGLEVDAQDPSSIHKIEEELRKRSFRSYYQACQNLKLSEGSGAYRTGFQAGFKLTANRASLFSVSATELDLTVTAIEGGDAGKIEILKKLDPVCGEYNIPFSRLYGCNLLLRTGSLAVQIRDYTYPLLSATLGRCEGRIIMVQQATPFQPQMQQDVYVGRWRKVQMFRSLTGTTPPVKTFLDLPIYFQKGEVSFGVGYEPCLADLSYAFTVALRRANLSIRNPQGLVVLPKKEKSLPWWDEMRNYIHGNASLFFSETHWHILGTTDPYEELDKLQLMTKYMEIQQSDGRVYMSAKDINIYLSSLESLGKNRSLKTPVSMSYPFLHTPAFTVEILMTWECASGTPLNHYLFALPNEGKPREFVFDPFRSTSLSLKWDFSLRPVVLPSGSGDAATDQKVSSSQKPEDVSSALPTFNIGAHDMAWVIKFWNLVFLPPHKLRAFSRFPRYGVPRIPRSGNLSMDRVMTEFMLRIDSTPTCIKHVSLFEDDPAKGFTFKMNKVKFEMYLSRGKQKFTFDCKREPLDLVYQGLDIHMLKTFLDKEAEARGDLPKIGSLTGKASHSALMDRVPSEKAKYSSSCTEKRADDGFWLSSDYFTIRKQAPKADPARLVAWQEAGRKNTGMTYVRSEIENGNESDDQARSDQSDDEDYNIVIADNCQRVFVYGLKLLWNIENRDAVLSWARGLAKAFEAPKPSPSRVYAQRKLHQEMPSNDGAEVPQDDANKTSSPSQPPESSVAPPSPSQVVKVENPGTATASSPTHPVKTESSAPAAASVSSDAAKMEAAFAALGRNGSNNDDEEEEGTRHFMVNVIEPQFNLHSEEANGRFLLAAVSGRVLARSFHSVLHVGLEVMEQSPESETANIRENQPEMTWKRMEISVMLERVQAHVAPTDVDPGAGIQWLPKIHKNSAKLKRTGALLERVFMPCDMYLRYTRHKGGTPDLKMKPLKELTFNSHDITTAMTSRQFQVMLDVLTNLLFARLPKPRKTSLTYPIDDDEDVEEEADEVVPDGVEEVELAKINLEKTEREKKVIIDDIRNLSHCCDTSADPNREEGDLWMINGGATALVQGLKRELVNAQKSRKAAYAELRTALQKAAQLRLMEKEKNKGPSYAMRISLQITKVVWSMLIDGKSFAEAEINDMIYDFDRDYRDIGVALFTIKYIVIRNCLSNAKSDTLLSAWNPPPEWGKKVMLRVDAKQGTPKDGHAPIELFQVEIYPLKIHLTESFYRMLWVYLFPEEDQDSQRRQEVWKVSTTVGSKRVKKGSIPDASTLLGLPIRETDSPDSGSKLRRTSSFDRSWEETVAESVANELVLQSMTSGKSGPLEQPDESSKKKDSKPKSSRPLTEEKKVAKPVEEKKTTPKRLMEFHNIKISQVELCLTYEGRFVVSDLKLLMDTFHRVEFTGTWRRLFSRVKKHIIWGVLKSVTGMQGKKFKDKLHLSKELNVKSAPDSELISSNLEGNVQGGDKGENPLTWPKRPGDMAGDGFVTSVRGLFNTQKKKAKKFVLRTMRGEENDERDWSDGDVEVSPFARQLTITKAKRLIRRHTKKFHTKQKGASSSAAVDSLPSSPMEAAPYESDSSSGSTPTSEDFQELLS